MAETTPPEVEIKQLGADLKKATDDVKTFAERAMLEMKNLGTVTAETKASADKNLVEMNAISARMVDMEQKMARRGGAGGSPELKTLGEHVAGADNIKSLMQIKNGQARVVIERKDITTATATQGTGLSPSTSLVIADRQALVPFPTYRLVVRDLITPGSTESNSIEYPIEVTDPRSTAARVVSEGGLKPQSDLKFDLRTAPVRTIAHIMKASRQIMDDAKQLQSYIDGRLRWGLQYAEEGELLYGDGTGQHLHGLIPQASAYLAPFAVGGTEQAIDRLRLSALQATLQLFPATGFVLHPTDWAQIEVLKDTMGRYLVGDPQGSVAPRLWGLPVVASQAMQVKHFLTGAFNMGAQIFDRMAIEVLMSTENVDDFQRNMITIRGEERLALAVYQPNAFTTGTLP